MRLNIELLPKYVSTSSMHELQESVELVEAYLQSLEGYGGPEFGKGKKSASSITSAYIVHESRFDPLLLATHSMYQNLSSSRLPPEIAKFSRRLLTEKTRVKVSHIRNIRVHWKESGKYFNNEAPIPPLNRDTRSVRWYLENYPKRYPKGTNRNGGNYIIGGVVSIRQIQNQVIAIRRLLNIYFDA